MPNSLAVKSHHRCLDIVNRVPKVLGTRTLLYLEIRDIAIGALVSKLWQKLAEDNVVWKELKRRHRVKKLSTLSIKNSVRDHVIENRERVGILFHIIPELVRSDRPFAIRFLSSSNPNTCLYLIKIDPRNPFFIPHGLINPNKMKQLCEYLFRRIAMQQAIRADQFSGCDSLGKRQYYHLDLAVRGIVVFHSGFDQKKAQLIWTFFYKTIDQHNQRPSKRLWRFIEHDLFTKTLAHAAIR